MIGDAESAGTAKLGPVRDGIGSLRREGNEKKRGDGAQPGH
jgi:hypothetical protein